jgi:hypothetical protein
MVGMRLSLRFMVEKTVCRSHDRNVAPIIAPDA